MARLSIPPSPCRGELDWLWGPTCTRAERGRGREGLGAWALVGEDGKVCARDCVECGEGHAASGALRMLRWSVVRAGSKHEELSSMHTRMSDLAWARVFRKPFRRPITFTRAARSGPAPHVRRSVGPVSYLLRPELRCSARSEPADQTPRAPVPLRCRGPSRLAGWLESPPARGGLLVTCYLLLRLPVRCDFLKPNSTPAAVARYNPYSQLTLRE